MQNGKPYRWRILLGMMMTSASPAAAQVVINEILYDPPGDGSEYVEVFNPTSRPQPLRGLHLADSRGVPVPLPPETPGTLAPVQWWVLVRDGAAFARTFPGVPFTEVPGWPALNNGGDAVVLSTDTGVVDAVAYVPGWGGQDVALERLDPLGPAADPANWTNSLDPTGGTPGRINSTYAPDRQPPQLEAVAQTAPLAVTAHFNEPLRAAAVSPQQFLLNDARFPVQVAVVNAGRQVVLTLPADVVPRTLTVAGVQDAAGNAMPAVTQPVARLAEARTVVVNEVLYDPLADRFDHRPDQPEYVELYNTNPYPVSLHGGYLTRAPDETGTADTLRWAGGPVALPAEGYAVVWAGPKAALEAAFPAVAEAKPLHLSITRTSAWRNAGDAVRLHRADGVLLDAVPYRPTWHHPDAQDPKGLALERIHAQGASDAPANWTSSLHADGGTPGQPNSVRLAPATAADTPGLTIVPEVFSPDGDGQDEVAGLHYRLPAAPALLRAHIFDAEGRWVRTLAEATPAGETGVLIWDGRDAAGHPLRVGIYVAWVEAVHTPSGRADVYRKAVVLARSLR